MKPKDPSSLWTNGAMLRWSNMQNHLRGYYYEHGQRIKYKNADVNANTKAMSLGMKRYFGQKTIRKPYVPPGETMSGTLYRGVVLTPRQYDAFVKSHVWTDRGYMAFSTTFDIAEAATRNTHDNPFSKRIIFYLPKKDIPDGTPWVWFGRPTTAGADMPKNKVYSRHGPTSEVLLPPGTLRAFRIQHDPAFRITHVLVKYTK